MTSVNIYLTFNCNCREAYYGMWTDKFGVNWMVNVDLGAHGRN